MNYAQRMAALGYQCFMFDMGAVFEGTPERAKAFAIEAGMTDKPTGPGQFEDVVWKQRLELTIDSIDAQNRLGTWGNPQAFRAILEGDK